MNFTPEQTRLILAAPSCLSVNGRSDAEKQDARNLSDYISSQQDTKHGGWHVLCDEYEISTPYRTTKIGVIDTPCHPARYYGGVYRITGSEVFTETNDTENYFRTIEQAKEMCLSELKRRLIANHSYPRIINFGTATVAKELGYEFQHELSFVSDAALFEEYAYQDVILVRGPDKHYGLYSK